jgi:hypothetical protein
VKFPKTIRHRKAERKIYGRKAHYKGLATKTEAGKWFSIQPAKAANVIPLAAVSGRQAQ